MKQISDQTPQPQISNQNPQNEHRPDPRVTRILLSLLIIAGGVALLRTTLQEARPQGSALVQNDLQEPLAGIRNARLSFKTTSSDITLTGNANGQLLSGTYLANENFKLRRSGSTNGGMADLRFQEETPRRIGFSLGFFGGTSPELRVDLTPEVPMDLSVGSVSGELDLDLADVQLQEFTASTTSGDINAVLPDGQGADTHLKTVAGGISVRTSGATKQNQPEPGSFEASSTSGDLTLNLENTRYRDVRVSTTAGEIVLDLPPAQNLKVDTRSVASDQRLTVQEGTSGEISVQSTGGEIELNLPANVNAAITTSTVGGEVQASGLVQQGNTYLTGSGQADLTINIKTVSGDIVLHTGGQ